MLFKKGMYVLKYFGKGLVKFEESVILISEVK
nr:MAG TPA: hypothetical protein [Caudoviricetes sp.]